LAKLRLDAGELNRFITVQSATESRTAAGDVTETWADLDDAWAEIQPLSAREFVTGNQIAQDVTHRIRMRHYPGLTPSNRIKYVVGGVTRYFNIHSVIDANEANWYMELLVKEAL